MAAMFSGYTLIESDTLADALWKGALLMATICLVNIAWLSIGAAMTAFLQDERASRAVNIAFAVLLLLSVALAVFL
jgi:threonine/homoserine/homoserine lactone efflux protein